MRRCIVPALVLASLLASAAFVAPQVVRDSEWPSSRPPKPLPEKSVKFPPFQLKTLSNGLQVVAVSHHEQPAISLRLLIKAGAAQDPKGKPGVANLVTSLLDQGTTTRSAGEIADQIDTIGGSLGAGTGTDLSFVNIGVMRDSFGFALELLGDIVKNPAFAAEEIARQRDQILSAMQVNYDDPEFIANAVMDRLVWGFHPYGMPGTGTPQSVDAITRDDLVDFHRTWFAPNNAILAVVGDVMPDEAFAEVERMLGSWQRHDVPVVKTVEPPPPTRRVVVVDRPGSVQTEIRIGNLAIARNDPDYTAFDLAVRVLGGEGANRLQRVLRTERGLTYAASADVQALKRSGAVVAETDTRSEATGEALRISVDEVFQLQRERVNRVELEDAQAYLTGHFPLTIETPGEIATQILNVLFYDLDVKELETQRERVKAVSVDDIQRVSKAYLHPSRLSIVLVGDAKTIVPQIRSVGFTELEVVPMQELDLTAADFRRPPASAVGAARH